MAFPWWRPAAWRRLARGGEHAALDAMLDWLGALRVERPLRLSRPSRSGRRLRIQEPEAFWATLHGATIPYTWTSAEDPARTGGAAYPYNGETGLDGAVVRLMHKPTSGDYRFEVLRYGAGHCLVSIRLLVCCVTGVAGATVTAVKGAFSVSGTTDPSGSVVLDIAGGGPGVYTITSVHGGLTSVETATLACLGHVGLDGGCTIAAFVADCCGNHLAGATVTVKGPLPATATVGTCTVTSSAPISAAPSCSVAVPNAGDYTVECDADCLVESSLTVTVPHCPASPAFGVAHFQQDDSPPTSLTDPLGNTIPLTPTPTDPLASYGCLAYTVTGGSLPSYPAGNPFLAPCGYTPDVRKDDCTSPLAYDGVTVPLLYVATKCKLTVYAWGHGSGFPAHYYLRDGDCSTLIASVFSGGAGDGPPCPGGPFEVIGPDQPLVGTGADGVCCPYVGEVTLGFAPSPSAVDGYCSGGGDSPIWLLTAIFGDSGTFTTT